MRRLTDNAILGGATLAVVIAAALLTFRWFASPRALTVRAGDPEAAATVSREFRTLQLLPKVVAVVPIRKPPPIPDRPHDIPKAHEGETAEPAPVVEASADPAPRLRSAPDICARHGGRKIVYTHHHHETWRCVYRRH